MCFATRSASSRSRVRRGSDFRGRGGTAKRPRRSSGVTASRVIVAILGFVGSKDNARRQVVRHSAFLILALAGVVAGPGAAEAAGKDKRLEVYWVDVEGGAATLIVTPAGESILVDAGFPGGRDAGRIHKLATEVGLRKIDHLVVTHYHLDHFGGVSELCDLMPVGVLHERGLDSAPEKERSDP